jgi:hypothetical protein
MAAELGAGDQPDGPVERRGMVVGKRWVLGGADRDVEVDEEPNRHAGHGRQQERGSQREHPPTRPQDEDRHERRDEQGQQVIAQRQPDEQSANHQVAHTLAFGPDERPMQDQRSEQQVQRDDLGDGSGRPDRANGAERQRRTGRDDGSDAQADVDEDDGGERQGDEYGRQHVRAERHRTERQKLEEMPQEEIRGVARRVGNAQDGGLDLHLAPVAERHAG